LAAASKQQCNERAKGKTFQQILTVSQPAEVKPNMNYMSEEMKRMMITQYLTPFAVCVLNKKSKYSTTFLEIITTSAQDDDCGEFPRNNQH